MYKEKLISTYRVVLKGYGAGTVLEIQKTDSKGSRVKSKTIYFSVESMSSGERHYNQMSSVSKIIEFIDVSRKHGMVI